jgi:hypothetical protein
LSLLSGFEKMVLLTEEVFREKDFKAMLFNINEAPLQSTVRDPSLPYIRLKQQKEKRKNTTKHQGT